MLNQLYIKNVAVIDSLEITFHSGMSVLTGETGAGKSIIIDSINMILGSRANKELVRSGTEKARVQAVFDLNEHTRKILAENDIDCDEDTIIITRTVTRDGKSTANVNGCAVTLATLREIADGLINIHGQHDNQALLTPSKHISFLDLYAHDESETVLYRKSFEKLRGIKSELNALKADSLEKEQLTELLKYQISEIEKARLEDGEEESLIKQRNICLNAEKLTSAVGEAYESLYEGGDRIQSAYDSISIAVRVLEPILDVAPALQKAYDSISDAMYTVEDSAHELKAFGEGIDFEENVLDDIESRLDIISKLKRKYGADIVQIKKYLDNAKKRLGAIESSDERTAELEAEFKSELAVLRGAAERLSQKRTNAARDLEKRITEVLRDLNMEKARFCVSVEKLPKFSANGADSVEFLISANPGEPLKPLVKVASGGELSRVMLAVKSVLAADDVVETMIFDEIDTGVSGRAARKIAAKLAEIARGKQVICITHLPQITCAADNHYLISKNIDGELASTMLTELDENGRIAELARMIDGSAVTETAIKYAKELLSARS